MFVNKFPNAAVSEYCTKICFLCLLCVFSFDKTLRKATLRNDKTKKDQFDKESYIFTVDLNVCLWSISPQRRPGDEKRL